ncbi:MAG: D-2-hydroxyacid dehydrogenase [Proteobacteria bacterium]|nr:D-2-hydroxyacid dehydrogenase [Pseudomonadota bacterium]
MHRLPKDFPELDWAIAASLADVERELVGADIFLVTNRSCTPELGVVVRRAGTSLKWIHFMTAGLELGLAMGLPNGPAISTSSGVKASMVSEHALALLLGLVRRFCQMQAAQADHLWMRREINAQMRTLEGATVCVVGLGQVGQEIARKLKVFGARVIAVSRIGQSGGDVDEVFPRARIAEALAMSDALIVCTAADGATAADETSERLISASALGAMKPGAFLVNVARGSLVDEGALIEALEAGRLAGAALDVAQTEPLPEASPLWDMPNVLISPHVAGSGSTGYPQHKKLIADNLERLRAGKPLINQYRAAAKR